MISLLWPEGIDREEASFPLAPETWKDLELDRLHHRLDSSRVQGALVKDYLGTLIQDPGVLAWRQEALRFLLDHREFARALSNLSSQLFLVSESGYSPSLPPLQKVLRRLSELESWTALVQGLHAALTVAGVPDSGPWKPLGDLLAHLVAGEDFCSLRETLPGLRNKIQGVRAVSIGINLNHNLEPVGGVLLTLEEEPYSGRSKGLLGRLFSPASSLPGPLHIPPYKTVMVSNQTVIQDPEIHGWAVNPKSLPLFRDLEEVMKKTASDLEKQLGRYSRVTLDSWKILARELSLLQTSAQVLQSWEDQGLPLCWPVIRRDGNTDTCIRHMHHPPLFMTSGQVPVPNDLVWDGSGKIHIITGPNSGGKTVYLQNLGWAQVLGQIGWPLPAREAVLAPAASFATHFQREEETGRGEGRFGEELVRLRAIFDGLKPGGIVLMNESLSGTNALEGYAIAWDLMKALRVKGARGGFTTHLHELARDVEQINQEVPGPSALASYCTQPGSFKVIPGPPAGRSLAREMAQRHGVTFEELVGSGPVKDSTGIGH